MKTSTEKITVFALIAAMMFFSSFAMAQSAATPKSAAEMVKAAKQEIVNLTPQQVQDELAKGNVILIDIRESEELTQNGRIAGAIHAPRGMLEFYADPSMPYYKPEFDKSKKIILHCASGGRSALATVTLKQMGYENIAHMDGGYKAWKESGKPVVE